MSNKNPTNLRQRPDAWQSRSSINEILTSLRKFDHSFPRPLSTLEPCQLISCQHRLIGPWISRSQQQLNSDTLDEFCMVLSNFLQHSRSSSVILPTFFGTALQSPNSPHLNTFLSVLSRSAPTENIYILVYTTGHYVLVVI